MKKIIVFIVYKAGWWGCFDSFYRKLSADETNECYVIPIPYYERQRDGITIDYKKRHYEAEYLPKDIPVTNYKLFNLEEHHADVLYIHNPYDDQNPMESVDPEYYSNVLKKYADLLIYMPHMLYIDVVPELMRNSPVYQNVDKIILASETVKKAFVGVPKEKLETAGSPLTDYIEKLSIINPDIPQAWKSMLPNGNDFGGKRVILYHVGYADLFYETERFIKKVEYVFNYMKTRKDVIFVWRPESEIAGKFDELPQNVVDDYLKLYKRFLDEKIGIYDTTDDECVASVLTDAYMGDVYPMMNLYGLQGKPIIILDKECRYQPSDDELCSVSFLDCALEDDSIWFVADEYNVLCKMNLHSGETEVIDEIPDDQIFGSTNYCGIVKENNQLYLNPYLSEAFVTYNINSHIFNKMYLSHPPGKNFDYIAPYKEYLFLKSKHYPAMIRYNTLTKEYRYYTDWVEELENYVEKDNSNEPFFLWGVVVLQNKLMLASSKANLVMEFNMETGTHKFYEVGPRGSKFFGMEYDGENYWLIPYLGKSIICWNYNTGVWETYSAFPDEIKDNSIPYRAIIKYNQSLLIFPCHTNFGLIINLNNREIKKRKFDEVAYKSDFYKKFDSVYNFAKQVENGVILAESMCDASIIQFNFKDDTFKKTLCRISLKYVKNYYEKLIRKYRDTANFPCCISEIHTLRMIIDYCVESESLININEKSICYSKINKVRLFDNEWQ